VSVDDIIVYHTIELIVVEMALRGNSRYSKKPTKFLVLFVKIVINSESE
jgi:hypothetical protein